VKKFWSLLGLFGLDVLSKQAALAWIPHVRWGEGYPFGGLGIFSWGVSCSLNTAFNTGAAWGFFPGHSGLLFGLRTLIIGGLVAWLFYRRETKFALWLIVAGAVGNALDFCLYGHVIDFIHVTFWKKTFPIFNLADSYITLGAAWLFLSSKKYDPRFEPQK